MLRRMSDPLEEEEIMEDWRDGLNSQAEVMGHLLSAQLFTNATLIVGQDKVRLRVVKEILQSLSRPLEQRLAGPGERRDEGGDELPIFYFNDLEPEAMKQLLKFAYTHDWSWSGEVKDFSAVLNFLRLVEKLGVKQLAQKIRNDVDAVMTTDIKDNRETGLVRADTACQIFEDSNSAKIENWKNCALQLILRSPSQVFAKVENYEMLTWESLAEILQNDELAVENEIQLFHIVNAWAQAKCAQLGQIDSVENRQLILKDLLPRLRFAQMTAKDFITHVVPSQLLEMAETVYWVTYFLSTIVEIAPIPPPGDPENQQPRKYSKISETSLKSGGSPANFTHRIEEFGESQKTEILTLISQKLKSDQLFLNLDIKLVSDYKILMSFLERTASNKSVKINLKVDTIKSSAVYEHPKSTIKFNQVTSLNFESLAEETQLHCLVEIVKNSPNLRKLSVGHFSYRLLSPATSYANMSKFLRMVSLQNLEFSCGFLGHSELAKETFVQLKGRGVTVKTLVFNWDTNPHLPDILDLVQGDLEEIHDLYHATATPTFQCRLDNLKILGIWCDYKILLGILKKTPNVEKIFFCIDGLSSPVNDEISLPKLTSLSVLMNHKEDPQHIKNLFANCANLSRLTCINYANAPMAEIYKNFGRIKKFRYLQNEGVSVDDVVGMETTSLTSQHLNHWMQDRPPYIGHLKELTSLSFGYKDYQRNFLVANWNLDMKVFSHGIGHLQKLGKISFPPMDLRHAKNILTFLSSCSGVTQLKLIKLQVWAGQVAGKDGTMKTGEVEKLAVEHAHPFKVVAKQVYLEDQHRRCYF